MKRIRIFPPEGPVKGVFRLPSSKSESNRALILQALSKGAFRPENLSEAEDTHIMQSLLHSDAETLDPGDAGTVMRFLTAYLAFQPQDRILTGSPRMQERPIGPLVEALNALGADIHYLRRDHYPPLLICGKNARWRSSEISLPGDISSQYISALLMLAPTLPEGLTLHLTGSIMSRPYIGLTCAMLRAAGIESDWQGNTIRIARQAFHSTTWTVESDWSAASYAYALAALSPGADLFLPGLRPGSEQGDSILPEWMRVCGVESTFENGGLRLRHSGEIAYMQDLDFRHSPDLAQTLIPCLSLLNIAFSAEGLESLRIKETDRILALQTELRQCGLVMTETDGRWYVQGAATAPRAVLRTWGDHRMAMGLAPMALRFPGLEIADPDVVRKSFPGFWESMQAVGFRLEMIPE